MIMKKSAIPTWLVVLAGMSGPLQAQVNDNCSNAIPLTVGSSCQMNIFSSIGASAEAGVAPNPSCGYYKGGDVWFTVVMPVSGELRYEIEGISGINPQTAFYRGNCGAFTEYLCLHLKDAVTIVDPSIAGETIYIRVFNYNSAGGGIFRLCVWDPPVPPNNNCEDASLLSIDTLCNPQNWSNAYATAQPDSIAPDPDCGHYKGGDVWFTFTMPASGKLRIELTPAQATLYKGSCGAFTKVDCMQLDGLRTICDTSLAGETMYLRVYTYNNEEGAPFTLCVYEPPIPLNDNCEQAIILAIGTVCTIQTFTNALATAQPDSIAPDPACGHYKGGDVWFTFTMPASGKLRIELSPAQATLYKGSCGAFTKVDCMQLDGLRTIHDTSLAGETMYLRVYSYNNEEGAPFTLCVYEPPIPLNDNCGQAIILSIGTVCAVQTFTNALATAQPDSIAPDPACGHYKGGDVWFTFTMPASGKLRIELSPAQATLYKGSCGAFTKVDCMQLDGLRTIHDTSLAGETMYLRVYTYNNEEGAPFSLCVYEPPVPDNDHCENAFPLAVGNSCAPLPFTNRFATAQPASVCPNPSCGHYKGGDVWFTAVMPRTGKIIMNRTNISGMNAQWAVYTGNCGNMTQIACAQLVNTLNINNLTLAETILYIRFFNYNNEEGGEFTFCVFDTTCNHVQTSVLFDSICYGESYTFPDGDFMNDITESLTDTSILINELYCDSLVITHLCVRPLQPALNLPSTLVIPCECFNLQLDAGPGYDSYLWNTGEQSSAVPLTRPGLYIVSITGCFEGPDTDSCLVTLSPPSVSGQVQYLNNAHTALSDVKVYLCSADDIVLDSTNTLPDGHYRFCGLQEGPYSLKIACTAATGGINNIDALVILRHFAEIQPLTGLNFQASDVNGSGYVNSLDALMVQRRYVELINTFPAGDWIFEQASFTIDPQQTLIIHIFGLCKGDANGSFSP